jgi:recombinational DNA repair protein (RecF pathway)
MKEPIDQQASTKTCTSCGESKPLCDFYPHRARCKKCIIIEVSKYKKGLDEEHLQIRREKSLKYKKEHRDKINAHSTVYQALVSGKMVKENCFICGSDKKVVAHHWNGYDKLNKLNVAWLCRQHHAEVHK